MGDLDAPDWGAEAHTRLLTRAGAYPAEHRLINGHAVPAGPVFEGLVQDDHFGVVAAPNRFSPECVRMDDGFRRGRTAYAAAGLRHADAKAVAGASDAIVVGAEVLGRDALIGAPRSRRWLLMDATLNLVCGKRSTGRLTRKMLAQWLYVCRYRRSALCILEDAFKLLPDAADDFIVHDLDPKTMTEFFLCIMLAPVLATDCRAGWAPEMAATDASPFGEAAVAAPVSPDLASEVWRHRDRKGAYTWLHGREAEYLMRHGESGDVQDFMELAASLPASPARALMETFDILDLGRHCPASPTSTSALRGFRLGPRPPTDLHAHSEFLDWVLYLIAAGRVFLGGVIIPLPSSSWAPAERPPPPL